MSPLKVVNADWKFCISWVTHYSDERSTDECWYEGWIVGQASPRDVISHSLEITNNFRTKRSPSQTKRLNRGSQIEIMSNASTNKRTNDRKLKSLSRFYYNSA